MFPKKKHLMLVAFAAIAMMMGSCSDDPSDSSPSVNPSEKQFTALTNSSISEFLAYAKTPRYGYHLDKAKAYLKAWAEEHGYTFNSDEYDNVWIDVPANTKSMESFPKVILQGHTDMVCASLPGESYDYTVDVGTPYYEGNLLKGRGINLGADDGIGVGMALAIASSNIAHGPLRLLFTANEDYGMEGAIGLAPEVLDTDYLINIDEEEIGKISVGCLGSYTIEFTKEYTPAKVSSDSKILVLDVTGLRGGHSGVMIGEHHLSAATMTASVVKNAIVPAGGNILNIACGIAVNAIANTTQIHFAVAADKADECKQAIDKVMSDYKKEYPDEPGLTYEIFSRALTSDDVACPAQLNEDLAKFFETMPQGVVEQEGALPTKSGNIGKITLASGSLVIGNMIRSYSDDWLDEEKTRQMSEGNAIGMNAKINGSVPAWDTPGVSPLKDMLLKYYKESYPAAYTDKAKGGLECAYFVLKRPTINSVSVGPQVDGAHSIDESLDVTTVKPLLKAIVNTLQHIGEIK